MIFGHIPPKRTRFQRLIARVTKSDRFPFNSGMYGSDRVLNDILCSIFKFRDIVKEDCGVKVLYLRRFYLWHRGSKETGYGGALFLHNIRRSDNDRFLHDHPGDFSSLILSGGYDEELPKDSIPPWRMLRKGDFVKNPAEHQHRVHLLEEDGCIPKPAWTLVKAGPARRVWGFRTDAGWVDWKTYLGLTDSMIEPSYGEDVIPKPDSRAFETDGY